ncbi:MAG: cyclase family protein [Chloroflexi bacterium]|nr:cyclase family protein [Chloroflexota bacterium]
MRTYPGIPGPSITAFLTHEASRARYQGQCELTFSQVSVVAGVGTYLDSPYHRDPSLPDFAGMPLEAAADVPGVVVDVRSRPERAIRPADLGAGPWRGRAVLLRTGLDAHWETDRYWQESPFLVAETAARLIDEGAILLGVDFLNVDDTTDPKRPVHTALLRARIPIVENLRNLDALPPSGFRLHAAPMAFVGVASFPVRAYAVVDGE